MKQSLSTTKLGLWSFAMNIPILLENAFALMKLEDDIFVLSTVSCNGNSLFLFYVACFLFSILGLGFCNILTI